MLFPYVQTTSALIPSTTYDSLSFLRTIKNRGVHYKEKNVSRFSFKRFSFVKYGDWFVRQLSERADDEL